MATEDHIQKSKRAAALRPEFVPLGLLIEAPAHGYELYSRFEQNLAGLWRISESQMYATIKRLEERGLVIEGRLEKGLAASRKRLAPSPAGRTEFAEWLATPSDYHPKVLKLEFLTRLYFAKRQAPDTIVGLFEEQRAAVATAVEGLPGPCPDDPGFDVTALARSFSARQVRSALAWLDECVGPSLSTTC